MAAGTVFERFDLTAAYPVRGNGMVLEYRCQARAGKAGLPFRQDYVAVIATAGGRIRLYREYLNPLNIPGVADRAAATALDRTSPEGASMSLDAILRTELCDRLAPGAGTFLEMFADEGVLECPFAPHGALRRLAGKDAIGPYYKQLTAVQGSDGMVLTASYPAEEGRCALLDYEGLVRDKRDGGTYRQRYPAVVVVSGGRIALFREYWKPLRLVASLGPKGPLPVEWTRLQA